MAKPRTQFTGKFRQNVDPTDPVLRECKRKVPYPIRSMCEKDAHAFTVRTGEHVEVYTCQHCGKFHFGHPSKAPKQEEEVAPEVIFKNATTVPSSIKPVSRPPKLYLPPIKTPKGEEIPLIETTNLGKLCDDFRNFYIFQMPPEMPHTEDNMLEHGVLVAMKKGDEYYKELDGSRSPLHKWRAYHHNISITFSRKKVVDFQKAIARHVDGFGEIEEEQAAPLSHPLLTPATAKKFTPSTADEYKGKKVWRDAHGKAFLKKEVPCKCCKDPILLLSRVFEPNGVFTSSLPYSAPDDPNARPTAQGKHTWLCGKCAGPVKQDLKKELEEMKQEGKELEEMKQAGKELEQSKQEAAPAAQPERQKIAKPKENDDFLACLQKMAEDQSVPSEQVRGMAFIAVKFLKGISGR